MPIHVNGKLNVCLLIKTIKEVFMPINVNGKLKV